MATNVLREIKAADVTAQDLYALEGFLLHADVLNPGPLVEFLIDLIESLRAGNDMVIAAADPAVIAAVAGLSR